MNIRLKIASVYLNFIILFFLAMAVRSPAFASSEFDSSYYIDYTVLANGSVLVDQRVTLTNRLANIYATEYSITIGSNRLQDIKAWDDFGSLEPEVYPENNKTNITLNFQEKVVGKDRGRTFHVAYKSPDFAQIKGQILEIGIPLLSDASDLSQYQVQLHIPTRWTKANYMLPKPSYTSESNGFKNYQFEKNDIVSSEGVTATFGDFQIFDFTLNYHLHNQQGKTVKTQISLPPDTAFQRVGFEKIEPPPSNVELDQDGNWLAIYNLLKNEKKDIVVRGGVKIFLKPLDSQKVFSLNDNSKDKYLVKQPFWPVDDPAIVSLSPKYKSPEEIYDYLVKNFSYDYQRIGSNTQRMGAVWALQNPKHLICMEFTDLFISLARANKIPAREVNGFAYTTNSALRPLSLKQDILHAWPEYYDENKGLWMAVDPTWGNTTGGLDFFNKLDLDHFVFTKRGVSSETPYPAGSYKLDGSSGKDVNVEFGDNFDFKPKFDLGIELPEQTKGGLKVFGSLFIKNTGQLALYEQKLEVAVSSFGKQIRKEEISLPVFPPYSQKEIPIVFMPSIISPGKEYEVSFSSSGELVSETLEVKPFLSPKTLLIIESAFGILIFLFIINLRKGNTK